MKRYKIYVQLRDYSDQEIWTTDSTISFWIVILMFKFTKSKVYNIIGNKLVLRKRNLEYEKIYDGYGLK